MCISESCIDKHIYNYRGRKQDKPTEALNPKVTFKTYIKNVKITVSLL